MPIAFFDLDRTVLSVNSGEAWVRRQVREGRLSRWTGVRAVWWIGLYHLGLASLESVLEEAVATVEGEDEAELIARNLLFFEEEVRHTVRAGAHLALQGHRDAGEPRVLLSTSSSLLCDRVAEELGLDGVVCTRLGVAEGRLTGRAEGPICFGPAKVVLAERWLAERGERLEEATFYTDSMSDLPVLERVARPVVVHPDPRLRRVAAARGWPIQEW